MKIAYIANIRIPTEKAHGLQIMKTCEALALAGQSVTLIVPTRDNLITADPFDYYKVALRFPVVRLENPDFVHWGFFGFLIQTLLFARKAKAYVKNSDADIVFGRDEMVLCSIPSVKPVMWETHTGRSNRWAKNLAHRARGIIAITKGLKDLYISQGVAADSIVVAPDAVDIAQFDAKIDRDDAMHAASGFQVE